ncbi:MAG: hypothetical protein IPG64_18480 [Haliea sp.]|jgi:hypothetical protein|nr:hypothetical protein [Haliea sp.]
MMNLETWELLSSMVTVIGLPLAIIVFFLQTRRERINDEIMVYESLSDTYQQFLRVALQHSDLHLFSEERTPTLNEEQYDRMMVIFTMLVSLFERAYILIYDENASGVQARRWNSWNDYMREWCAREDFRVELDKLLQGEDEDFCRYIRALAAQAASPKR